MRIGGRICDNAHLILRDCISHRKCINTQRGQTANTKERAFQELVLGKIRKMDVIKNEHLDDDEASSNSNSRDSTDSLESVDQVVKKSSSLVLFVHFSCTQQCTIQRNHALNLRWCRAKSLHLKLFAQRTKLLVLLRPRCLIN